MKIALSLIFTALIISCDARRPFKPKLSELTFENAGFIDCYKDYNVSANATFEQLLCLTSHKTSKPKEILTELRKSEAREMLIANISNSIQNFIDRSRPLAYQAALMGDDYDKIWWKLDEELIQLKSMFSNVDNDKTVLRDRILLAENILHGIIISVELMRFYRNSNAPGRDTVWSVIALNQRLVQLQLQLQLQSSSKSSDINTSSLTETLGLSEEYLSFAEKKMRREIGVPFGVYSAFRVQLAEALQNLKNLKGFSSKGS